MKTSIVVALLVAAPFMADAECPNSCSGHGTCGVNDQCTCYQGFRGNSCEQRTCPYGKAWATTPQGDLNYDGDLNDASVYDGVHLFTSREHVITAENSGGTWEYWPSTANAGEGHFEMECSNAGLCNKETGECQCFAGFEGYACERMACPGGNDCNGHGRCMTINQQLAENNANTGSSVTYTLWDGDAVRSCKCDPGYSGIDCMQRTCPKGDDPLTTAYQIDEVQVIEIYTTDVTQTVAGTYDNILGGTFTATFTDHEGERYTTSAITFQAYDGSTAADAVATNLKSALEAFPNNKLPSVTVTAGYCEKVIAGTLATDYTHAAHTTLYTRCPEATLSDVLVAQATGFTFYKGDDSTGGGAAGATAAVLAGATAGCTLITYPQCIRLYVKFSDPVNTGPQNLLRISATASTGGATLATPTVSKSLSLITDSGTGTPITIKIEGEVIEDSAVTSFTVVSSRSVITWAGTISGAINLPAGAKVRLYCGATLAALYDLGEYGIYSTHLPANAGTTTLETTINDPQGRCVDGQAVRLVLKTNFIQLANDLTELPVVATGMGLKLDTLDTTIKSSVASVVAYDATLANSFLLLTEKPVGVTTSASGNAETLTGLGTGTKEADVCSGRGNCDSETGECKCFKGYSGERCDTQNALWVGA